MTGGLAIAALAALAFAGASVAAPQDSARLTIELPARAEVGAGPVSFGKVAFLTTEDLPALRRAMAVPLGTAPRAGAPVVLDRDTLAHWVARRTGLRYDQIVWRGAPEVEVAVATQELSGQRVADAAEQGLRAWLGVNSQRFEVMPVSGVPDLVVPAGAVALQVRPIAAQSLPSQRMRVWIDLFVDERFVRTLTASFEVNAWAELAVAGQDLAAGQSVRADQVRRADVDLTRLRGSRNPAAGGARAEAATLAVGQRLREPLRAGDPIATARTESEPLVRRGTWAAMDAQNGNVSVQSRVEVLQDGRPGETVRVKMPGASGSVLARVVGLHQVELQP